MSQLIVTSSVPASHRPGSSHPQPEVSLLGRQQLETKVTTVHHPDPTRRRGERKREGLDFCCTRRAPLFSDSERNGKQLSRALQPGYGYSDSSLCPDRLGEGRVYLSFSGDLLRSPALCGVRLGVQGEQQLHQRMGPHCQGPVLISHLKASILPCLLLCPHLTVTTLQEVGSGPRPPRSHRFCSLCTRSSRLGGGGGATWRCSVNSQQTLPRMPCRAWPSVPGAPTAKAARQGSRHPEAETPCARQALSELLTQAPGVFIAVHPAVLRVGCLAAIGTGDL